MNQAARAAALAAFRADMESQGLTAEEMIRKAKRRADEVRKSGVSPKCYLKGHESLSKRRRIVSFGKSKVSLCMHESKVFKTIEA